MDIKLLKRKTSLRFASLKNSHADGGWKREDVRWKMEEGRWKREDGRGKMEDVRCRM